MLTKLLRYLILPAEISEFERAYLQRMNRIALWFFAAHVPVMTMIAWVNDTGAPLALVLTSIWMVGPILAYLSRENPRHAARISGFTAMVMGALLVHFGQGPMQIEMHFYFFVLLALLAVFADPLVVVTAAITVAVHHAVFFVVLPKSVFNYDASVWTVVVHAAFVVLESVAACFVARSFFDNVIGLDRIVRRRTEELDAKNRDMRLVLDNVGEGFLTIDLAGKMSLERSAILESWLGPCESSMTISEYIGRADPVVGERFSLGWEAVVEDIMPLELTIDQLPKRAIAGDLILALSYRPILDGEKLARMLVQISDVTPAVERERIEADQREMMQAFERVMRDRAGFVEFFAETTEMTRALTEGHATEISLVKRLLHTLKGNSALFGLHRYAHLCHALEDRVAESGELCAEDRVTLGCAYHAMSARLSSLLGEGKKGAFEVADEEYASIVRAIARGLPRGEVLCMLDEWKLESAQVRLERFADQARATARRMGKDNVDVIVEANGVRLPPEGWTKLWSAFVHAVRNAVDHGVETQDERLEHGKSSSGRIKLSAARTPEAIVVAIEDDGRGVDWEKIADKAREKGLPFATRDDLVEALFTDGLTTKDQATQWSGRGVGMSAMREACMALGGALRIESVLGKGTRLELRLPPLPPTPAREVVRSIAPHSAAA